MVLIELWSNKALTRWCYMEMNVLYYNLMFYIKLNIFNSYYKMEIDDNLKWGKYK